MSSPTSRLEGYLQNQLTYDHTDDKQPTNTRAMVFNQHRLIRKTIESEGRRQQIRLLDIGCGWGDLCGQLRHSVVDYVGVEPSLVELKRFTCSQRKWLVRGIGEHLAFVRSSSRNVILLNSVLDHCIDWRRTFDNCMRILAPGGVLVISMENADKISILLSNMIGLSTKHEGHVAFFSMRGLVAFLRKSGLRIERHCSIGFLFGFHTLTKKIPIPENVLRPVNRAADAIGGRLSPHGGHVMFVVARKGTIQIQSELQDNPFQCCTCGTPLNFATTECSKCHRQYSYVEDGILDTTEDPEFRAVTGVTPPR